MTVTMQTRSERILGDIQNSVERKNVLNTDIEITTATTRLQVTRSWFFVLKRPKRLDHLNSTIVTKTPHEYIKITYEYIRVTCKYMRVIYKCIQVHTPKEPELRKADRTVEVNCL